MCVTYGKMYYTLDCTDNKNCEIAPYQIMSAYYYFFL